VVAGGLTAAEVGDHLLYPGVAFGVTRDRAWAAEALPDQQPRRGALLVRGWDERLRLLGEGQVGGFEGGLIGPPALDDRVPEPFLAAEW
jgi:hypothetical protein